MNAAPYLTLRGFRVWFAKRQGFLESLRGKEPEFVKAVDGIDLDVGKGEVYCLVGESGCGKTTTGKGILGLVRPSGGDVFVNVPAEELARYEKAKAANSEATLEAFRRRWSLSYREKAVWTWKDAVVFLLTALGGAVASTLIGGAALFAIAATLGEGAYILAILLAGILLGFIGTLPFVKATARVPLFLALVGLVSAPLTFVLLYVFSLLAAGRPADLGAALAAYGTVWGSRFDRILILAMYDVILALAAWRSAKVFMEFWQSRKGIELDRFRKLRKQLQIVFQDPYESLNPKHSVYDTVSEPLIVNRLTRSRAEMETRVERALSDAGLRPPKEFMFRYPHELSGGQRQRVSIAGALVVDPDFVVADEPVSMLDVSIRTEIVELLLELRRQRGLTYLFITHDLSLAWVIADRIGVMYLGKIVEEGPKEEIVRHPRHPYTQALITVVPVPDPDRRRARTILRGERPDPSDIPAGCRFHPRCPAAFERCGWTSDEVLEDLQELAKASGQEERMARATLQGTGAFTLAGASEAWLRSLIAERAEEVRALKAIQDIVPTPGGIRVLLHEAAEPPLEHVSPDVQVACHLFR